jgi:hypothetical protein
MWYLNQNLIIGADTNFFYPTQSGYYSVVSTDSNGCVVASDSLYVLISGIVNSATENVPQISPNPSDGNWSLQLNQLYEGMNVSLYNAQGQMIRRINPVLGNNMIEGESLPIGFYLLEINFGDHKVLKKLVRE